MNDFLMGEYIIFIVISSVFIGQLCMLLSQETKVVYHLQQLSGNSGWKVNGTGLFGSFQWKISGNV